MIKQKSEIRATGGDVTVSAPAHSIVNISSVKHITPLRLQNERLRLSFSIEDKTMPLFEGLGSGGEKTAVVIDLGAAYTK